MEFLTHDNGGRKYSVKIDDGSVFVKNVSEREEPFSLSFKPEKVFIGKSGNTPMTRSSGGIGKKFDGNSMLFAMGDNKYIYIGTEVINFTTNSEIVKFVSDVGNNNVPYPYAIDVEGAYYLMIENVKILYLPEKYAITPYWYYYKFQSLPMKNNPNCKQKRYVESNIDKFYIGEDEYIFRYPINPGRDWDWHTKNVPIYIVYIGSPEKIEISKERYVSECNAFNVKYGFEIIDNSR
ncbi:MAG: hypothetical protein KAS12_04185 [Candidatus Aenigmarchaeota archaeon]|nr:hypothetical protein [Candidatus Aenigmarchaeota archaeon]